MQASLPTLWHQTAAATSKRQRMLSLVNKIFGETPPTYGQYMALRQALMKMLVDDAKSTSPQYVRKPLAEAIRIRFDTIPRQDTPEAARKRRERRRAARATKGEDLQDKGYSSGARKIISDVRAALADASPPNFQRILCDLFCRMGYAASLSACRVIDGRGDGGFDLNIWRDRLGLSQLDIQVKCWVNVVRERIVREFYGALQAKRQRTGRQHTGVFITKSAFSHSAARFGESAGLVLLDLAQLVELMIEYELGVCREGEGLQIDRQYFSND
ncbi:restriction endonuclease [Cupriavidus taiwanensis]|uniref:restriction endonuclease n=1 Tax=Cupriavidus taiwanensis TaxID=164546 RepID=UPI0018DCA85C|nr:restriction endonuclease [Cupriavidus taiwanensis]